MSTEPSLEAKTDRDLALAELTHSVDAVTTASLRLAALVRRPDVVLLVANGRAAGTDIIGKIQAASRRAEAVGCTLEQLTGVFDQMDVADGIDTMIAANKAADIDRQPMGFDEQTALDQQEAEHAGKLAHAAVAFDNGEIPGTGPYRERQLGQLYRDRQGRAMAAAERPAACVWRLCSRNPAKRCDCNSPVACEGGPAAAGDVAARPPEPTF